MSAPAEFRPYWVDQLWHDMAAQGRARLAPEPEGCVKLKRTPEHLQAMRAGLQRYHERRRQERAARRSRR